ncbi:centromere protein H-like isoform X1 [Styela clava]
MAEGSTKKQTGEILESIEELTRLRDFLQSQIDDCSVRCSAAKCTNEEEQISGDSLVQKIEQKRADVLDEKARQMLKDDVIKTLLYSREALHSVYPNMFPPLKEDQELSASLRTNIKEKLAKLHETNKKILDLQDKKTKLRQRHHQLDLEIRKIISENKESMNLLQISNKTNDQEVLRRECELKYPVVQEAKVDLEKEVRQLRTVKYIFQCLIQASKLDWFEDKELYELVIQLGQNDDDLTEPGD